MEWAKEQKCAQKLFPQTHNTHPIQNFTTNKNCFQNWHNNLLFFFKTPSQCIGLTRALLSEIWSDIPFKHTLGSTAQLTETTGKALVFLPLVFLRSELDLTEADSSFRNFSVRCILEVTWRGGRILSTLGDLGNLSSAATLLRMFLQDIKYLWLTLSKPLLMVILLSIYRAPRWKGGWTILHNTYTLLTLITMADSWTKNKSWVCIHSGSQTTRKEYCSESL